METIGPGPDRHEAAASLAAVADAQRAVRDRPWPLWLYPTNALLLGGVALAGLVEPSLLGALVVLALSSTLAVVNYRAGRLIGTPFAVPTSRGFRVLVAVSGAFVVASLFARAEGTVWLILVCAAGAVLSYGLGSVMHYRSTHR